MPRPSSKIMQINPVDVSDATEKPARVKATPPGRDALMTAPTTNNVVKLGEMQPEPAAAPAKRAKKEAVPELTKAEKKAKIADLKAALKLAREPLDKHEAELKAALKGHAKTLSDYVAVTKVHERAMRDFDKLKEKHAATAAKYSAVYDKTVAKINAEIAKLSA